MLNKEEKRILREDLFRYLDGLVTVPVAYTLHKKGIVSHIEERDSCSLDSLSQAFDANEGYLNVALRILCSQGWLIREVDTEGRICYRKNEKTRIASKCFDLYKGAYDLLHLSGKYHKRKFQKEPFEKLYSIFESFKKDYAELSASAPLKNTSVEYQILKHIEGHLLAPSIVALGMGGMFHKYFMEASFRPEEFHKDGMSFGKLLEIFTHFGWFRKKGETLSFTDKGLFFAKRASAFGVTVSYLPMFRQLDDLIFGDGAVLWNTEQGSDETHVDRIMNVWGSGGAHGTYFKKVDDIIISIFNKPIEEQPKGIVDMGCGNGAYLQHLYEVIEQRTERGKMLDDHPLFLVGADYNNAALKVTRANLIAADIWAKVIWGDIGRPDLLAKDLKEDYNIELHDLLNVRTFLDHNRIWQDPIEKPTNIKSESTGAFAFRGKRLDNNSVEQNLKEHLLKWSSYVKKFGLLLIELHTIDPELTANNLGKTAATAYDATHGFSDQYIVEIPVFKNVAAEAGLYPVEEYFSRFPNSELATVSINLLRGK